SGALGASSAAWATRGPAGTPMRASAIAVTQIFRNTLVFALSCRVRPSTRDNARYLFVVMLRVTCRRSTHRPLSPRQDDRPSAHLGDRQPGTEDLGHDVRRERAGGRSIRDDAPGVHHDDAL